MVLSISMASNNNVGFHSWSDQKGGSFELAARVIALGATNIAAFCVSLYVFKQHMHRSNQHASMIALASAHLCAVVEMGLLVASCYHGWGSKVDLLTQPLLADKSKVWFGIGVAGMTIDAAITGMSIYLVANLQMTRAKKLYTISVFSAGLL
ncbi:hypothetical protein KC333_g5678 [Hortaea werneckii]|nr:hypothetical protein KC333_g5678 [Hortaea werneckii]KAI7311675.1 hypothetical protein KC326_g6181 [Hortaea werneckii]